MKSIPAAIKAAKIFLLVVSPAALASDHVYSEVHLAKDEGKTILPVRVVKVGAIEGPLQYPLVFLFFVVNS